MGDLDGQSNHALADDEDLVAEILTRLPVKSLMRFRSVSKPWRGLISQPHFTKKHWSYANSGITKNSSSRVIFLTNPPTFIWLEDLESLGKESQDFVDPTKLQLPVTITEFVIWDSKIVGSCHGLICLEINHSIIVIWNPITGESKLSSKPKNDCVSRFYGFGYDFNMDDYKVVLVGSPLVECDHSLTSLANQTTVQVFALKSDCWNFHEWREDIKILKGQGCLLNGALHWLEFESSEFQGGSRIMSFHLAEEKFEEIPLPFDDVVTRGSLGGFNGLMKFQNRLCVYSGAYFPTPFTIRMLEKYEDKESWVEILKFDNSNVVGDDKVLYLKPLCILESGQVLVDNIEEGHGPVLALYNPEEEIFREIVYNHKHWYFDTIICEETLISPLIRDNDAARLQQLCENLVIQTQE